MRPTSTSSFFRFLTGFLVFISLSFGITYTVQTYTLAQEKAQTAAAAQAAFLGNAQ